MAARGRATGSAAGGSGSRSEERALREVKRSLELAEHLGDVSRYRAGLWVAIPTWLAFGALDWVAVVYARAGSLSWFWTIRLAVVPIALYAFWAIRRTPPPSRRHLQVLDLLLYGVAAYAIALMAVRYGGIASSYLAGIMMVLVVRGAFTAQRWTVALVPNLVMASSYPLVMGLAMVVHRDLRGQLSDPTAWTTAIGYVFFIYGTMVLALAGTHHAWTLRRQLLESLSIGRYKLDKRLGRGGMGEVWAAYDPGLKRTVALKILKPDPTRRSTAIVRFEREVKATSKLAHPNTVRVFDFGVTEDGILYYAMELLEGPTLHQLVRTEGAVEPARAVHMMLQAARALAEAHEHGIVHRDVKPDNLIVTEAGGEPDFVKVIDFGIAKLDDHEGEDRLTKTGDVAGTPKYVAPEVVRGEPATAGSDVWGLGATLYFLLTGKAPFRGATSVAIYKSVLEDAVIPPRVLAGSIPKALDAIVVRCLAKAPDERFDDAAELGAALGALDLSYRPRRRTTPPSPPEPADLYDPTVTSATR